MSLLKFLDEFDAGCKRVTDPAIYPKLTVRKMSQALREAYLIMDRIKEKPQSHEARRLAYQWTDKWDKEFGPVQ